MNDELTPRRIVEYLDQYIIGPAGCQEIRGRCFEKPAGAPANFLLKLQRKSARKIFS